METMFMNLPKLSLLSIHTKLHARQRLPKGVPEEFLSLPLFSKRASRHIIQSRISPNSKKSLFQDFQDFAKPLHLLPATKPNTCTRYIPEEILSSMELDESHAFYVVELRTSKDFGSCLSDLNAAILLCMIDAKGNSILQRISAVPYEELGRGRSDFSETMNFQRGSVDIVTFKGAKLGKIEAVWIGLETGSWRLDSIHLIVISSPVFPSKSIEDIKEGKIETLQYKFRSKNVPLGEGGLSVAELRPELVTELCGEKFSCLTRLNPMPSNSAQNTTNEESMREYADLKLSLLTYDLMLVAAGSAIASVFAGEELGYSFLFGGITGFLYLLLLQRSVDGLSITGLSMDTESNFGLVSHGFKGPLFSIALILVASIVAVKYGLGGAYVALTPTELFMAVAGFLTCKIAVVLAAFTPLQSK